jgi:hypothetical protein
MQTESPQVFIAWVKKHPVWVSVLIMASIPGLFAQWISGKIFDSWFGSAPPFTITINVEPALNVLSYVYPIASGAFLCVLFVAVVQMASDRLRGALPGSLDLAITLSEVVLARVSGFEFALTGKGNDGDYLLVREVLITNRDLFSPVSLTIRLRAKMSERERVYRRTNITPGNAFTLPSGLPSILLEPLHDDPVNLDRATGKTGLLAFRVPGTSNATQVEELRVCPMVLEFQDSLSGRTGTYPVPRTREQWRALIPNTGRPKV